MTAHFALQIVFTMAILPHQLDLKTNKDDAVFRMTEIEKFRDRSGYKCQLLIHSGGFAYDGSFYFDEEHLLAAVEALRKMDTTLSGEAVLKGAWDEDHFKITVNEKGHVIVSGALFQHGDLPQALKFAFRTDQTVLKPFGEDLAALLTA